ncbi:centromere protein T isoform X2 [Dunckerocampus dactyliophorus]|uniref:centromere protein T isoform X2 n=1 Tax=Dunckerocampus dactyliophorus TaxID=161453 RepID=UPI0024054602|nr:centromere protein T isoform X2 [Dunckerocampus dactyliophorus]
MDSTEDLSARVLLKHILTTEPPRTPVTRSISRGNNSAFIRHTRSSKKNAGVQTPQDILRRSLRQNLRESISRTHLPPASKRRTASVVVRKASSPMLFDEGDTPRHILMNILRTEPVKSPVIHEEVAPLETQVPSADSSVVTHSNIALSGLDLPDLTFGNAASVAKRLSRKRPRRMVNVSTFEKRLREGEGENEEEDLAQEDLSLSLSNATSLSLKTPFGNVQTEKKGLRRRIAQRRKITEEGFGDAVNKMLLDYGASGFMQGDPDFSESAQAEAFTVNKLELTNDISHSNTSDAPVCNVSILGIQDQSTVAASQIQSAMAMGAQSQLDAGGGVVHMSGSQEEKNTAHCEAELETPKSEEEDDDGEEEEGAGVESQTEEDAAAPSEGEDGMEEGEGTPVDSQAEEDVAASSQEEDAATPSEEEDGVEEEEGALFDSQAEDAAVPSKEEDCMEEGEGTPVDSQAEEDVAASSQEEDAAKPSEEEDGMEEGEGALVDSQAEEDTAVSSQEDDAAMPSEEEDGVEEEEQALVDSQAEEGLAASSQEEDAATPLEEEDNMEEDEEAAVAARAEESASVTSEEEDATATRSQSEEEDTADDDDDNDGHQHDEQGSKYDMEHISLQAPRSEAALVMPVEEADITEPGWLRGSGVKNRTHREEASGIEAGPAFHHLEVSSDKRYGGHPIEAPPAEDAGPHEQEEWEEEDHEEEDAEIPMKTPAFVRERRTFQVAYQASPTVLKPQASSTSNGVPLPKPKRVRKPKSTTVKKGTGLPKNYLMGVFRHFAKAKVSADVYPVLNEIMDKFFERMADDLETFAAHAKRKTIEVEDVELLLRRQGHVNDKVPVEVLIEKYLRMDQRKLLIPIATSGNVVIPKMRR